MRAPIHFLAVALFLAVLSSCTPSNPSWRYDRGVLAPTDAEELDRTPEDIRPERRESRFPRRTGFGAGYRP